MSVAVRPLGIRPRHLSVLMVLVEQGPTMQRDLVEETGFDKAVIMRLIDDLDVGGFAVRKAAPVDRRLRIVEITPNELEVFEAAQVRARRRAAALVAHLQPGEAEQLMGLLTKFTDPPDQGAVIRSKH